MSRNEKGSRIVSQPPFFRGKLLVLRSVGSKRADFAIQLVARCGNIWANLKVSEIQYLNQKFIHFLAWQIYIYTFYTYKITTNLMRWIFFGDWLSFISWTRVSLPKKKRIPPSRRVSPGALGDLIATQCHGWSTYPTPTRTYPFPPDS